MLLKTARRVVYASIYESNGKLRNAVNVVTLYPPRAWHLDFIGDEDDELADYLLTRLGPGRTRLDMKFEEHYKTRRAPSVAQDLKHTHQVWDRYVTALEKDYADQRK